MAHRELNLRQAGEIDAYLLAHFSSKASSSAAAFSAVGEL